MDNRALAIYFFILGGLCAAFVAGARLLGEQGAYLAQGYMMTPALAALITRLFFYPPRFRDANLRIGRLRDYFVFWLAALGITVLAYAWYTALGAVRWDPTGQSFLDRLTKQFAASGQDINATLPPGFTPQMMLLIFFIGGLTVFNILPGIITGFGEEFGHRGFMFPLLYRIKPWAGLLGGGLIWYAWHWPLLLVVPQAEQYPLWQSALNFVILGIGSVCTFIYLAYVYVKSRSVWVTSVAHIALNNSSASFSYLVVIQSLFLANAGITIAMLIVVGVLYWRGELRVFREYFAGERVGREVAPTRVAA